VETQVPATITTSAHKEEILALLLSGWSPARVHQHIRTARHQDIPAQDIATLLATLPSDQLTDPTPLARRFPSMVEFDAPTEMSRLLQLQANRLQIALALEGAGQQRLPYVDTAVRGYWKMLLEYVETKQSLGDLPLQTQKAGTQINFGLQLPGSSEGMPTLRALLAVTTEPLPNTDPDNGAHASRPQPYKRTPAPKLLTPGS